MMLQGIAQQPNADDRVELYTLDATPLGGEFYRFTPGPLDGDFVVWQGENYAPIPCESSGWEWNGKGSLPQPTLRVANVNRLFNGPIDELDDMVGFEVTRTRTFRRFLDGESEADPDAYWPIDYFVIEQKTQQNKIFVEWTLSAQMDQQGTRLPRRPVLQNACTQRYRVWNGSAFVYTKATCPYAGSAYFDKAGNAVSNPALDKCGKRLSDCQKRFGNEPLPTWAFPGVGRVRI